MHSHYKREKQENEGTTYHTLSQYWIKNIKKKIGINMSKISESYAECMDPNCLGKVDIEKGYLNAEAYGSNSFIFECPLCRQKYKIIFTRSVIVRNMYPAPSDSCLSFR